MVLITVMWFKQPEAKETGHTPEITGLGGTKDDPVTKKTESMKPQLRKSKSQDTLEHPRQVLSETHCYRQEAYSTSTVQTITSKSTVERKEQTHTSFSHTHKFSMSSSPVERDRRTCTLQQSKRPSQDTPPPVQGEGHTASSYSEFQTPEKQTAGLRAHRDKFQGVSGSHAAAHTDAKVCEFHFTLYPIIYTLHENTWTLLLYCMCVLNIPLKLFLHYPLYTVPKSLKTPYPSP